MKEIPKTVSSVTDILDFFRLRAKIRALKKADDTQLEVTDKTFAVLQNIAKSWPHSNESNFSSNKIFKPSESDNHRRHSEQGFARLSKIMDDISV